MRSSSSKVTASQDAHRRFLNNFYRYVKYLYNPTRRAFLFGRERALKKLLQERWTSLVEVGVGTGRNLQKLHRKRPEARYAGVDASCEMLSLARRRCPFAAFHEGFAEDIDYLTLLGKPPDRILFSYSLSMIQDTEQALANAQRSLAAGGRVVVVDFGDMNRLPLLQKPLTRHLSMCHVKPLDEQLLRLHGGDIDWGAGRYYVLAVLPAS